MNSAASAAIRAAAQAASGPGEDAILALRDAIARHRRLGALSQIT
ncbi:MAG TPA: hypothetical protein VNS22_13330 [Geminicoccus sp.]|nr:hypothetical protein [Geminicoccus sp.]HWL69349.1 hypothetical protein [Geminicoccus sp.]